MGLNSANVWEQRQPAERRPEIFRNRWKSLARRLFATRSVVLRSPSDAVQGAIVIGKKSAVYRDRRGQLRVIEFFLPPDLLAEMQSPIEIQFLEGEEFISAEQFHKSMHVNFRNIERL
jgi:hypothetical protein